MNQIKIREKIKNLPKDPGCYLMKDTVGRILYVGKAKNLKARVSQYFARDQESIKTRALVEQIADFDLIMTQNEIEALLLERTLIKHHKPRFNVLLRDDKEYPYLRINFQEDWPRIEKVRRRKEDGATYLGPFSNSGQLRILVDAALRIFPIVRCSRHEFQHARRPCTYYHMKLCLGPCKLPVDQEGYKATVQDAVHFLAGKNQEVLDRLKIKMRDAADNEDYERAALYRDQINAFAAVTERQNVVTADLPDADVIGLEQHEIKTAFHVLTLRNGTLVGQDSFLLKSEIASKEEALYQFLLQYYDSRSLPSDLLLPFGVPEIEELRLALLHSHPETGPFQIHVPQRGPRRSLIDMAQKNAEYKLTEMQLQGEKLRTELVVLQEKLRLSLFPKRMECIDISNTGGTAIVASNVCFVDGKPAKDLYRHYNVQDVTGGPDDFRSIAEVVKRRLNRAHRDGDLPDLLVIDGGRGQLSSAWKAWQEVEAQLRADGKPPLPKFDLIALAKAKGQTPRGGRARHGPLKAFERVFRVGEEVPTPLHPGTPEFRLLTQLRDEAHRFAITHHRLSRSKLALHSPLTAIPGIGSQLQKKLLTHFGSIENMQKASLDELQSIKGLRESSAVALHSFLQNITDSQEERGTKNHSSAATEKTPIQSEPSSFKSQTYELAIKPLIHLEDAPKNLKSQIIQYLEACSFTDYVEAMIDGVAEPLPSADATQEELWSELADPSLPLCVYRDDKEILESLSRSLHQRFPKHVLTEIKTLSQESWQEAWLPNFQPIITSRFEVRSWTEAAPTIVESSNATEELCSQSPLPIIRVLPSEQAGDKKHDVFGDGRHGTTEVCLKILAEDIEPSAVPRGAWALDLGTGSGILSLAAAILGYEHLVLTDLDPEILKLAQHHIDLNKDIFSLTHPRHWYPKLTSEVPPAPHGQSYQQIMANILVPVLHELLPKMAQNLKPGGHILLSGFIDKEAPPLLNASEKLGLSLMSRRECRGWVGLLLTH